MKDKLITLQEAVEKVGKIYGKKNYRTVTVSMNDDGMGDIITKWSIYSNKGSELVEGDTFNDALKNLHKALYSQKQKRKTQDVKIKEIEK